MEVLYRLSYVGAGVSLTGWQWGEQDSNLRRHTPTGLQPVSFNRSDIPPIGGCGF